MISMITKSLLIWLSLVSPNTEKAKNTNPIPQTQESIQTTLSENPRFNKGNTVSSQKFLEILQWDIKQKIINWTLVYFDKHVTFKLTTDEKAQLKKDLWQYLSKYPNVIKLEWKQVILNLDENSFQALFKTLLPYFGKWEALKDYPDIIKTNDRMILNHIKKSKGDKAEFYFYHYFWYLVMDIVESMWGNMTIWYYTAQMLEAMPIKYIKWKTYNKSFLNADIKSLPLYY